MMVMIFGWVELALSTVVRGLAEAGRVKSEERKVKSSHARVTLPLMESLCVFASWRA